MTQNSRCLAILFSTLAFSALPFAAGCLTTDDLETDDRFASSEPEIALAGTIDYASFRDSLPRLPENGAYVVERDIAIHGEDKLRAYYAERVGANALVMNEYTQFGVEQDSRWSDTQKKNLTYCVSNTFGTNKAAVVAAMATASTDWEKAADVNFTYVSAEDARCDPTNTKVVFDVRPRSSVPWLGLSFFPSEAREARSFFLNTELFTSPSPRYTLAGVARHELGHVLGFRHEHVVLGAAAGRDTSCQEYLDDPEPWSSDYRAITTYDSSSVMHYPQCNGTQKGDLVLTARDKLGARCIYDNADDACKDAVSFMLVYRTPIASDYDKLYYVHSDGKVYSFDDVANKVQVESPAVPGPVYALHAGLGEIYVELTDHSVYRLKNGSWSKFSTPVSQFIVTKGGLAVRRAGGTTALWTGTSWLNLGRDGTLQRGDLAVYLTDSTGAYEVSSGAWKRFSTTRFSALTEDRAGLRWAIRASDGMLMLLGREGTVEYPTSSYATRLFGGLDTAYFVEKNSNKPMRMTLNGVRAFAASGLGVDRIKGRNYVITTSVVNNTPVWVFTRYAVPFAMRYTDR